MALASSVDPAARGRGGGPCSRRERRGSGRGSSARTWTKSFEQSLFVAFALMVGNDVAVSVDWISRSFAVAGGAGRTAIVVALAGLVGSAVLLLFRGVLRPGLVYFTVGALVGAQVLFAVTVTEPSGLPRAWWAWQLMIPVCVLITGGLRRARAAPILLATLAVYAGIRLSPRSGPGHGLTATVSDLSAFLLFAALIALLVPAWRRTAEVADGATRARNLAHAATEAARAAGRRQRATARLLHDEVIHALRAVSLPVGAVDPAVVRSLTRRAGNLLADGPLLLGVDSVGGLSVALAEIAAQSSLVVRVACRDEHRIPLPVVAAIGGAVGEALRNVERHSGVAEAAIMVRSLPFGVEIRVVDQGRGFDPDSLSGSFQFGYRNSIVERLADVGGSVMLTSEAGAGTTVCITWSVQAMGGPVDSSHRLSDLAGTRTRLIVGAVVPMISFAAIQAALNYRLLTDPVAALLAVGVADIVTVGVLLWARTRPVPRWMSMAVIGTALMATVVGGWELHAGGNVEVAYFAAGVGAPALALVAFFRPPRESVLAGVAVTIAAAAMVHRMDTGWDSMERALPAVMSTLVAVVAVLGARLSLDRMSRDVMLGEEIERQAETVRAELAVGRTAIADRLGRVRAWALPFVLSVARGDLDPAMPAVQDQAAVLEAAIRDDLRLGECLDDIARALIGDARAAGRTVEINAEPETAALLPDGLVCGLVTAALAGPGRPDRIVLTISALSSGEAAVSLLVAPMAAYTELREVAERIGAGVVVAAGFLLVRAVLGPNVSPLVGTTAVPAAAVGSIR